jgi:hypothetical protein
MHSSLADVQCPWHRLCLTAESEDYSNVLHLAYLPIKRVQELESHSSLWELQLPVGSVPNSQLAGVLHQATTNLSGSSLWKKEGTAQVHIWCDPANSPLSVASLTPQERVQVLEALAPLGSPHLVFLDLHLKGIGFVLGRAELQTLNSSLGPQLESLDIEGCTLTGDFWSSLPDLLPSLETLRLGPGVVCQAMDMAVFCCRIPPTRSLSVSLDPSIPQESYMAQLQESLRAQGFYHVSVC